MISMDAERAFDKIKHFFVIKKQKVGKGNYFNLIVSTKNLQLALYLIEQNYMHSF